MLSTGEDRLDLLFNLEFFARLAYNIGQLPWIGVIVMGLVNTFGGDGPKKLTEFTRQCIETRMEKGSASETDGERHDML
jgi:hypothetical protein